MRSLWPQLESSPCSPQLEKALSQQGRPSAAKTKIGKQEAWYYLEGFRGLTPWKESYDQQRQHIKKQRHYFTNKGPSGQGYGFSSGHVRMWELDCEENWAPKNWCFWTMVLEKTLESPLDCKEIQPVHPRGDQSWLFIGRTDAEAETPILWPPREELTHWKSPRCWEGLGAGGEGDDRGWDGWMASPTRWTWVWVSSGNWWWTGRTGVLWFMVLQRVGHNWTTKLNWTEGTLLENELQAKIWKTKKS